MFFEFYIHYSGSKKICKIEEKDDGYDVWLNDEYLTQLRYDHHGKWFQVGGQTLPEEVIISIGDGIDSYLMSH